MSTYPEPFDQLVFKVPTGSVVLGTITQELHKAGSIVLPVPYNANLSERSPFIRQAPDHFAQQIGHRSGFQFPVHPAGSFAVRGIVALIIDAILRANVTFLDIAYMPQARSGLWSFLCDLMLTLIVIAPRRES